MLVAGCLSKEKPRALEWRGQSFGRRQLPSLKVQRAVIYRGARRRLVGLAGGASVCTCASIANRSAFKRSVFSRGARAWVSYSVIAFRPSRALFLLEVFFRPLLVLIRSHGNVSCAAAMPQILSSRCRYRFFVRGVPQHVAATPHGFDVVFAARGVGELLAQLAHEHVDDF